MNITSIFIEIEKKKSLSSVLEKLFNHFLYNSKREQVLSAFCQIALKDPKTIPIILSYVKKIKDKKIKSHLVILLNLFEQNNIDKKDIFNKLFYNIKLEKEDIQQIVKMSLNLDLYSFQLTIILNLIKFRGLSLEDTYELSIKMAESGKIYDYRKNERLNKKLILRRYPTGGVSEKIALIMPSLLKCLSVKYDFVSPFLVAKTLSFTGGTWDKLSSIPDFNFPNPGDESISILEKENICMTVAKGEYNPSDTFLYQLRSITNTVNSVPLIISSIASKQISNPVDTLLLDIRYGENAFLKNIKIAKEFFVQIEYVLNKFKIKTIAEFTSNDKLFGSTIGNYLEVIESICIMKNQNTYNSYHFDEDLLEEQKKLVILMTSRIISEQFNIEFDIINKLCSNAFLNFDVYESFKKLLSAHGVKGETILKIEQENLFDAALELKEFPVHSHRSGIIEKINQKNIGNFVNMELEAGTNYFNSHKRLYDGVLIKKKTNSITKKGEIVAIVYSKIDIDTKLLSNKFFNIK